MCDRQVRIVNCIFHGSMMVEMRIKKGRRVYVMVVMMNHAITVHFQGLVFKYLLFTSLVRKVSMTWDNENPKMLTHWTNETNGSFSMSYTHIPRQKDTGCAPEWNKPSGTIAARQ